MTINNTNTNKSMYFSAKNIDNNEFSEIKNFNERPSIKSNILPSKTCSFPFSSNQSKTQAPIKKNEEYFKKTSIDANYLIEIQLKDNMISISIRNKTIPWDCFRNEYDDKSLNELFKYWIEENIEEKFFEISTFLEKHDNSYKLNDENRYLYPTCFKILGNKARVVVEYKVGAKVKEILFEIDKAEENVSKIEKLLYFEENSRKIKEKILKYDQYIVDLDKTNMEIISNIQKLNDISLGTES